LYSIQVSEPIAEIVLFGPPLPLYKRVRILPVVFKQSARANFQITRRFYLEFPFSIIAGTGAYRFVNTGPYIYYDTFFLFCIANLAEIIFSAASFRVIPFNSFNLRIPILLSAALRMSMISQ